MTVKVQTLIKYHASEDRELPRNQIHMSQREWWDFMSGLSHSGTMLRLLTFYSEWVRGSQPRSLDGHWLPALSEQGPDKWELWGWEPYPKVDFKTYSHWNSDELVALIFLWPWMLEKPNSYIAFSFATVGVGISKESNSFFFFLNPQF